MLEAYEKLCANIADSLTSDGMSKTLKKYFQFPERDDLLCSICSKLHALILKTPEDVSPTAVLVYSKLQSVCDNPELFIGEDVDVSNEDLIKLLTTQQLQDCPTTSVKYVNGTLRYAMGQSLEDMLFAKELNIDKHTTCISALTVIRQLLKSSENTNEDLISALCDRAKVLKKISSIAQGLTTKFAVIQIDRKGPRLKTDVRKESPELTYVTIN